MVNYILGDPARRSNPSTYRVIGRGVYFHPAIEVPTEVDEVEVEQERRERAFMAGCNPMLKAQVEAGKVGIAFRADGSVRLVEGSSR